jgi:hypothetical protein
VRVVKLLMVRAKRSDFGEAEGMRAASLMKSMRHAAATECSQRQMNYVIFSSGYIRPLDFVCGGIHPSAQIFRTTGYQPQLRISHKPLTCA